MPAAPAVIDRTFMPFRAPGLRGPAYKPSTSRLAPRAPRLASQPRPLERSRPEQEVDEVSLVRLQPVQLRGPHGPEIEAIDVDRVEQPAPQRRVLRQGGADERRPDRLDHLRLGTLHHRDEGEHVLLL